MFKDTVRHSLTRVNKALVTISQISIDPNRFGNKDVYWWRPEKNVV